MVSQSSTVGSQGLAIDHVGAGVDGLFAYGPVVPPLLLGNPAFDGVIPHGEAVFGDQAELAIDGSSHGSILGSHQDEAERISVSSGGTPSPNAAMAINRVAENAQLFRAAFQINANERERSIQASRRVLDLQSFILNKGFSMEDVNEFLKVAGGNSPSSPPGNVDGGLQRSSQPSSHIPGSVPPLGAVENIMGKKSWAKVVQSSDKEQSSVFFDYCPMPPGSKVIAPPDEVLMKGIEKFKGSLVGTFTKGTLSFTKVSDIAHRAWGSKGLCNVAQKSATQFLFKFATEGQMSSVLAKGTWYFANKPMVITAWGNLVKPEAIKSMPLWIKLSQIPECYWTREGLSFLASAVGKPLCADQLTSTLNPLPFAKMCVNYNLGDPLPESLTVAVIEPCSGEKSTVEVDISYPQRPLFCSGCSSLGHTVGACPSVKRVWVKKHVATVENVVTEQSSLSKQPCDQGGSGDPNELWSIVKRKGKETSLDPSPDVPTSPDPPPADEIVAKKGLSRSDKPQNKLPDDAPISKLLTKAQRKRLNRALGRNSPPTT